MTLAGKYIDEYYEDLVQLEQNGAGLPSHAGAHAALYDGLGNQIIGRTQRRHYLDPDPDTINLATGIASKECLTDQDWSALSTEGWVRAGTQVVPNIADGHCEILCTGNNQWDYMYLPVSLSGDFEIWCAPWFGCSYDATYKMAHQYPLFLGVAASGSDLIHMVGLLPTNLFQGIRAYTNSSLSSGPDDGTSNNSTNAYGGGAPILAIARSSGTVYLYGTMDAYMVGPLNLDYFTTSEREGWLDAASVADATTYDRLYLFFQSELSSTDYRTGFQFLRRYV